MVRPVIRLGVLLLFACGPEAGDSATETGGSSGATEPTSGASTGGAGPESLIECQAPSPCPIVDAIAEGPGVPAPTEYTAAQTCALEQLAGAGPVRLHSSDGCEGMCYGALILVRSDASVIVAPYSEALEGGVDLDGISVELAPFSGSELCALKPTTYFEGCLKTFDPACAARSNWFEGCAAPAPAACVP